MGRLGGSRERVLRIGQRRNVRAEDGYRTAGVVPADQSAGRARQHQCRVDADSRRGVRGRGDGKLHALSTSDGSILWEFDTNKNFDTVNKVAGAHGGAISSVGPVIAGGMMYIGSGYGVGGGPFGNVLLAFSPE